MRTQSRDSEPADRDPTVVRAPTGEIDGGSLGLADEHMLGEISHELGNYFHKLYYWVDYLKARAEGREATDITAVDMLGRTVGRLEHFIRMTLEYFAPARLCFDRVTVGDLVGGIRARLPGRVVHVGDAQDCASMSVHADPALMAYAMRTIVEGVGATLVNDDRLVVSLARARRREFCGIELEFVAGAAAPAEGRLTKGIEMVVAEKFLQMHGGELCERTCERTGRRALVVFLPIYG